MDSYSYLNISAGTDTGALDLFVAGTEEVYVITPVDRGWRFSRVTRRGSVSVTVADGRLLPGLRVLDALRIAAAFPGGGDEFFEALHSADMPVAPLRAPADMLPTPSQLTEATGTAIRHFLSGRDIDRALSFPAQEATARYSCTILAPATAALRQAVADDPSVTCVDTPLVRRYAVIFPEGVRPSEKEIEHGKELTLTYFAEGMADNVQTLQAGRPSPFVEYDGATMRVRPLSALGITLEPKEEEPSEPSDISEPSEDPEISEPSETTELAEIQEPTSEHRKILLALRFDEDRVVRSEIDIKEDSSEYKLLRAGNFHGHRARRLPVKVYGEEGYLIDLREEPREEPAESQESSGQAANVDDAKPTRKKRGNGIWLVLLLVFVAIAVAIVAVSYLPGIFEHVNTYDTTLTEQPEGEAAAVVTVTAPVALEPSEPSEPSEISENSGNSENSESSEPSEIPDPAPEPKPEPEVAPDPDAPAPVDPKADYAYLNRSNVWYRDSLRSPDALAMFDLFATGKLGTIASDPFFASGKCTNPTVMKTVRLIWQAKGSSTQTGNQRALQRLQGQTVIDFDALYHDLDRLRSDQPNTQPFPSTK